MFWRPFQKLWSEKKNINYNWIIRFNLIIILSFTIILLYIFLKECYLDMSSMSSNTKTTGIFILNCNWGSGGWLKLERSNTDSNVTSLSPSNMNNAFVSTTSHIGDVKSSLNFKLIKRAWELFLLFYYLSYLFYL